MARILIVLALTVVAVPAATARTINITDAPYNASVGAADNAPAIQAAIDALLGDKTQSGPPGRGGTIVIPAGGCFKIASPVGINVTVDFRAWISIVGEGGRRAACLDQTTANPVFELKTTSGNVRDFELRNVTLVHGTVGLNLSHDAYNIFDNVVFDGQTQYAVRSVGSPGLSEFRSNWFVNQLGNNVYVESGGAWFTNGLFGEASGGFDLNSAALRLDNCAIFNSWNRLYTAGSAGEGNALFRVEAGASLILNGGSVGLGSEVTSLIYTNVPRDVIINGTDLGLGNASNLIANRYVHTGTKPYPILMVRAARVSSTNTAGLNMYNQVTTGSGAVTHAHEDAVYDVGATEYVGTAPFFDPEFTNAAKRNAISIHPRLNRD